jgi:thiamine biosynthesis lipoprotein
MMFEKWVKGKMEKIRSRREFLKFAGALGIGATPLILFPLTREKIFNQDLIQADRTRPLMGTYVTVTVLDPSEHRATEAMEAAFTEIERLISLLDRHSHDTPVARLNRAGCLKDVPPEVYEVVDLGRRIHGTTGGLFDITVKPLLDLFENNFSLTSEPPPMAEIQGVLKQVGSQHVRHSREEIRFLKEGMQITLDGIAKGYIVDRAISVLKSRGIKHGLINAGGDIRALGGKGDRMPWKIAVQDPMNKNKIVQIIPLIDRSIATSGNYENYFDTNKRYHHIVNPETGLSPQQFVSASVLASSLSIADALSTAIFIPSSETARDFIRTISGAEALWIDRKKAITKTDGWGSV